MLHTFSPPHNDEQVGNAGNFLQTSYFIQFLGAENDGADRF